MRGNPALRLALAFCLELALLVSATHAALFLAHADPPGALLYPALALPVAVCWSLGWRTPALRALGCTDVGLRRQRFEPPPRESWLTLLLGILAILQGAKELLRLPQFHVPAPLFGFEPDAAVHAAWVLATSAGSIVAGLLLLQLRRAGLLLALALAALTLASNALSWNRLDAYAERLVLAKRSWEGTPVHPGEVERLKRVMPIGLNAGVAGAAIALVALRRRFDR